MSSASDYELHSRRSELKHQGRFAEAIPIQQQILSIAQQSGRVLDVSNGWNMLSHLYQMNGQLTEAEEAAKQALAVYENESRQSLEILATYEMKLAMILAAKGRCEDAVAFGDLAIEHFSDLHSPQDDFLKARVADVELMKWQRDKQKGPASEPGRHWSVRMPASEEAIERLQRQAPGPLPNEYLDLLRFTNGGEGPLALPPSYFMLYEAEYTDELNQNADHRKLNPGYFVFGSNGGLESIAFDMREKESWPIVMYDSVAGTESAVVIAKDMSEFIYAIGIYADE